MPLPGLQMVTVTGRYAHPDGTAMQGTVSLEPTCGTVVSASTGATVQGTATATFDTNGDFTLTVVATDATGINPTGFTYNVRLSFYNAPTAAFAISLPKAAPTVTLPAITPVAPAVGNYVVVTGPAGPAGAAGAAGTAGATGPAGPQPPLGAAGAGATIALVSTDPSTTNSRTPTGAASGALTGTYPNPSLAAATAAAFDAAGAATSAQAAAIADAATKYLRLQPWVFDVTATAYGAVGDAQAVADGAMATGSAVLTSASANFATDIVGKSISVKNAAASGVTTLVTTVASRQGPGQITLTASNASGGAVTGAVVIWGSDNTAAIQAAVDAAEAYLTTHTYAQVYFPPRPYIVAGTLNTSKSGNGQIIFGVYSTSAVKRILEFRGETDGAAAVRHWQQTVPQFAGSCLISLGVYASTTAQNASIGSYGNPGVISGPSDGSTGAGYGKAALYSNVMAVLTNMAIITTHSAYGLTYGAANLWGCANAHIKNFGYGTAGTVASPSTDYNSPGVFATGLSIGLLLPANGNNDHNVADNISCGGGYTYACFLTEHGLMGRYMALYCWAGLCPVGTYNGSVGATHGMYVTQASIEVCTHELYFIGPGSNGITIFDCAQLQTESGTPNVDGNSTAALAAVVGRVKLTGLFTPSGVSIAQSSGLELVNGQVPRASTLQSANYTAGPIDRTILMNTTAGPLTLSLPNADYNPVEYVAKNVGTGTLTVAALTSPQQKIDGNNTIALAANGVARLQAKFNGTAWGWYAL